MLAGEESGMLYANGLKARLAGHEVRGYQDYGFATADLAVMGFGAVVAKIPFFIRVKRVMERAIDEWRPDIVCTIDYPGMNLKLAAYAKRRGIKAVHVVCPQVWAWRSGRIPKIEAALDKLCCFFPFEPSLFKPGFAEFVGHPLAREFRDVGVKTESGSGKDAGDRRIVAVLPGSREGEVRRILPTLLKAVKLVGSGVRYVVPAANPPVKALVERIVACCGMEAEVEVRLGGAREVLRSACCAAVASGTATLEATFARCPTVLVYRVGWLFATIARIVIKGTKYVGLANIVWQRCGGTGDEAPMPELLQENFTPEAVARHIKEWLSDDSARMVAARRLDEVSMRLETDGDPLAKITQFLV